MSTVARRRLHAMRWWSAATLALVAGHAGLALGATTAPAALLVAGYLILVPAALLRR